MRISGFRLMWLLVMFDLPVTTRTHRRNYKRFLDDLIGQGFFRVQFSVYARPCATEENADTQFGRVKAALPPAGEVRILRFTDKQWARMVCFYKRRRRSVEEAPEQFAFFDEDTPDGVPVPERERVVRELEKLAEPAGPPPPSPSGVADAPPAKTKPVTPRPPPRGDRDGQASFEFYE